MEYYSEKEMNHWYNIINESQNHCAKSKKTTYSVIPFKKILEKANL